MASMASYLRSVHQHRTEAVMKLFESEVFGIVQPILTTCLQPCSGTKSYITRRLAATLTQVATPKSCIVIELSPVIKPNQSTTCPTFYHFADIVYRSITYMICGYEQCDVVADQYFVGCFKEGTRKKQGNDSSTMQFTGDPRFLPSFDDFLSSSANKNNLSQVPPQKLLVLHDDSSSLKFVVTLNDPILTKVNDLFVKNGINYCAPEEALMYMTGDQASRHWLGKHYHSSC